jgi:nucleotide-binding universal stress UspA family protein
MTAPLSFRSILVPLDGSPLAEQAVPLAAEIARRAGSKLRLVLVHEPPPPPVDPFAARLFTSIEVATRKAERTYLRDVRGRLQQGGTRVTSAVTLSGAVGPALATYVRELGIELVVMGTHGRGGLQRTWIGSVADHLIRHLGVPVLLVRSPEGRPAREWALGAGQIMVPLDGSPLAEEALDGAVRMARLLDAEIALVQVVRPVLLSADPSLPVPSSYDEELTGMWRSQAQDYLDGMIERLQVQGLRASGVAVIGWRATESILDLARPERVAMVVIATHGRGGLRRLALGSVADKVVRGADVPVLVYRPSGRRRQKDRSKPKAASRGKGSL